VGSSHANLYASVSAGISALWGPLHGGANQAVLEMLENIRLDGGNTAKWLDKAKDKSDPFRLMGFGHRVYKNFDPRATIIKKAADSVLEKLGVNDPLLEIGKKLEEAALNDDYFKSRKLFPNVDFYSGIIYRAIGFPVDMFTVCFRSFTGLDCTMERNAGIEITNWQTKTNLYRAQRAHVCCFR